MDRNEHIRRLALEDLLEAQQSQQQPQAQSRGIEPSAFISEASGMGGAGIGAFIGSAAGPLGTLAGAGIGGLLGGFGGSVAEQNIRDDEVNLSKALREGALEGLFGFGPVKAGRIGLRGVGKVLGREGAERVAKEGAEQGIRGIDDVGRLRTMGEGFEASARGIKPGVRASRGRLGVTGQFGADELNDFATNVIELPRGSAVNKLRKAEGFIKRKGKEIDDILKNNDAAQTPLSIDDKKNLALSIDTELSNIPGGPTDRQIDIAKDLKRRIGQAGNVGELNQIRRQADTGINFNKPIDTPQAREQRVLNIVRNALSDEVGRKVPALQEVNQQFAKASNVQDLLLREAGKERSGISPAGLTAPGRAIGALKSGTGAALENTGRALDSTSPLAAATRAGLGGTINSLLEAGSGNSELQQALLAAQDEEKQGQAGLGQLGLGQLNQPQPQDDQFSPQNIFRVMQQDIQQTGGQNFEALRDLLDVSIELQELSGTGGQQLSSAQSGDLQSLGGIESSLNVLLQQFDRAGGGAGAPGGLIRNIGTKIPGVASEARAFEGLRESLIAPLARTISGEAGVLTDEDIKRAEGLLPKLSDTPMEAQRRIQNLRTLIAGQRQNIMTSPQSTGGGQQDLMQALLQTQGL